ncbi:carboxymuconolactone decarboxylase family protein [uncultured Sphaerochaeta sp.]|uniref:carboxymuconolactone decarboxylase family protein n=1 Tax=uncultured Sphaerochaeta sp. TaxID=886478 RepID=UPI002D1E44F7|nr:carboxymuconolactone decarboxylase family protein [uncultured Sphaerochaeta sp.]
MNTEFMERIMLAVTEVNGCPLCSYAHTNLALESGMSNEEIQKLLSGDLEKIPLKELPAILFSQHYAESRGKPNLESWNRIVEIYGNQLALGILGAIRMIMMGNAFGIVLSSLQGRFKRNSNDQNPLFYELGMLLLFLPFLLISIPHRVISFIVKRPIISFV